MKIHQLFEQSINQPFVDAFKERMKTNLVVTTNRRGDPMYVVTDIPAITVEQFDALVQTTFDNKYDLGQIADSGPYLVSHDDTTVGGPKHLTETYVWYVDDETIENDHRRDLIKEMPWRQCAEKIQDILEYFHGGQNDFE